jgi:putative nucleotidyltransferase with HDIG domain
LDPEVLRPVQEKLSSLTRISGSNPRIYMAVADPNTDIEEVTQLVSSDPDLAARILRVVNSPSFGLVAPVKDLPRAIAFMGYGEIRTLVLRTGVDNLLQSPRAGAVGEGLWQHSYACSVAALDLAQSCRKAPPAMVATIGLLHDLGRFAVSALDLDLFFELESGEFVEDTEERCRREEELLGVSHATLGALLARQWGLPEDLVQGIGLHGLGPFTPPSGLPAEHRAVTCIVHCANSLAHWLEAQESEQGADLRAAQEWVPPAAYLQELAPGLDAAKFATPELLRKIIKSRQVAKAA